jgi:uncharacterized protein HemX
VLNSSSKSETGSLLIVVLLIVVLAFGASYVYINAPQIDNTHVASEASSTR